MKIGFIGAGNMARAIIAGLLKAKAVAPADIIVHGGHAANYQPYAERIGATAAASNAAVVEQADWVVLAVAPPVGKPVLREVHEALAKHPRPLLSLLTGVDLKTLAAWADQPLPLVRVMPNLNVALNAGMTAYAANAAAQPVLPAVVALLNTLGESMALPEADFSTFVALAGSSPAFVYMFIDALSRAGVKYGLTKQVATKIAAQAVMGSGLMAAQSTESPMDLADQVASPGGTTVAGMLAMAAAGFMPAVVAGVDATIAKDRE
ncbi:pyrroline-5-carboxylate reductase [Lacticaseibacillus jixianensis]|uniref:Pyrroline-5-carboxylate reductase n=1 Tax=Lacticaseibacillus jixianensis TaxID=2486012 RepID=A0ABW4BB29_9LACO|nr:pyrroline-5-carboxylate reductase [Lacticaseibacillus jixianensis]